MIEVLPRCPRTPKASAHAAKIAVLGVFEYVPLGIFAWMHKY